MSPEQFAAVLVALAAVFGAVAKCIQELREYHAAVNSKMDRLLELTATSSHARGVLEGHAELVTPDDPPHPHGTLPSERWRRGRN